MHPLGSTMTGSWDVPAPQCFVPSPFTLQEPPCALGPAREGVTGTTVLLTDPNLPVLQPELGISPSPMAMAPAKPPTPLGMSLEPGLALV